MTGRISLRAAAALGLLGTLIFGITLGAAAQTLVLTQHNDNLRSGLNSSETILNTSNVNYTGFGKLFSVPVEGAVMAQPLYVPAVQFPGGVTHNVLVVATEYDVIYAFDADGVTKTPLWTANLVDTLHGGSSGEAPLATPKNNTCTNITPNIGVTATPVIDTTTQPTATIFTEAWSINGSTYLHRLHALDITTGLEKANAPVVIAATVSGTGDGSQNGQLAFNPEQELARPGLLLLNGIVYIGYSSMCDYSPYHGWVMSYDENTLAQKSAFATTPNGGLGGIWMSGTGIAADSNGYIYVPTGNGYFDTTGSVTDFGDTLLKLSTTDANGNNGVLGVADYFTPFDQASLSANDRDLASGGAMLLPDQPGNYPHQVIMAGKQGRVYEVNRDQLTSNPSNPNQAEHYCTTCTSTDNQILQETANDYLTDIFGEPAYWNENIYYWGASSTLTLIPITNGLANFTQSTSGALQSGFPGPEPAVSSNGNIAGTAIVWAITPSGLYAYDATNLSNMLWNSTQAPNDRDQAGAYIKYSVPTITNGKMYVGAGSEVDVYGLLPSVTPSTASLRAGQTQQFATPMVGAMWAISPAGEGTISQTGFYTAPATITMSVTVTVTASTLGETAAATVVLLPTATGGGTSATFVNFDTTTQGNWMGVYGATGYSLANAGQSLPGYDLSFTMANQANWTWASPTTDPRALQTNSTGGRIAASWYGVSSFSFDVNLTDGQSHQVAFYVLDWDGQGRVETVQIFDASATQLGLLEQRRVSNFGNGTYLVFNITGHVTVTFTCNSGPNAPLSGVFFSGGGGTISPAGTATFVGSDTATQGAWQTKYGADGYFAAPTNQSAPTYAFFSLSGQSSWTWATGTTDPRALQFSSGSVAAAWYSARSFSMSVDFTDGNSHQVALYALDWDKEGRSETIQVLDGGTGAVLDSRTVSNFGNGIWLVWTISGSVQVVVTQVAGPNGAVSGIFFGGGTTGGGPTGAVLSITSTHSGSFTQGQQNAIYTVTVSNAAGAAEATGTVTVNETLPGGLTLASMSGTGWTCSTTSESCTRGDALGAGSSYPSITVTVNVAGNASSPQVNQVSVSGGGSASANASDSTAISSTSGGNGGGATAAFVNTDATTSGQWQGIYGIDGYVLANVTTQMVPAYATFAVQNEINYTWAASTSDPRALENPAGGSIAAAWYNPATFNMSVNITDGNTHEVALYAVDWDHGGRAETVQIFDAASNNLLDTRTLTSFSNGEYLVWNISGSVKITVTATSGPNAVISGIFFGGSSTGGGTETVTVTPGSATLAAGALQQFSATVTHATTQNVTWVIASVSPSGAVPGSFSSSTPGLYIAPGVVTISETVTISATSQDGTASGTATITLNPTTSGSVSATYIGTDTNTEGSWKGIYGAEGYILANVTAQQQPTYGSFSVQNQINYSWAPSSSDPRALELPSGGGGIAATWYNPSTFTMTVNVADGNSHQFALYAVDWDQQGRSEKVQISNAATNATLDTRTLSNFGDGAYLVWSISGSVKITVTQESGPNAVVSGVFFGSGTATPTLQSIQITPSAPSIALGNTQQLTATGKYSDGSTQNLSSTAAWSTSPTGIATVSASGLATSAATGQTTVSATSGSISGTATLTVIPAALVSIQVTPTNSSIQQGTGQQYAATGTYTDGTMQNLTSSVMWSTSDSTIASISASGLAMGVNTGMVTIGATLQSVQGGTMLTVTSSGGGA